MTKKILTLCAIVFGLFFWITSAKDIPQLILFYWETCPHCKNEEWFIDNLKLQYEFEVVWYEVYYDRDNQKLMAEYGEKLWTEFTWVPVIIMWNDYFVWESYEGTENLIKKYATPIWGETQTGDKKTTKDQTVNFLWVTISLNKVWPIIFWIVLGLADGINPCMFWVLIFLLTYLISIGSRKKVLYSWFIFAITTFILYFAIMYLMHRLIFSTSALLPYIATIRYGIWILAIILWLIEIKDFFFYWKGISLKIPSAIKPTLEYITKKGTYMSAFILAVLSTFVELPCTIWIPLAYIGAVWENTNLFLALGIYNICFIIPLIVIILGMYYWAAIFKRNRKWEMEITSINSKKIMRLVAGIILVTLWILFLTRVF